MNYLYFGYFTNFLKMLFGLVKKIILLLLVYFLIISLFFYFGNNQKKKDQTMSNLSIENKREELYENFFKNEPKNPGAEQKLFRINQAIICLFSGEFCTNNPEDWLKNHPHSILGFLSGLIVFPYTNPPASGIAWSLEKLQETGFIPKAYAIQGIGMASIMNLSNIWLGLRNFSFMIAVLVIVTLGFLIMFRAKLNPQTVISIENSLPKIIITLLLIQFSFPIAGFLIDLMYVLIGLIISLFGPAAGFDVSKLTQRYITGGFDAIFDGFFGGKNFFADIVNLLKTPKNVVDVFGPLATIIYFLLSTILGFYLTFKVGPFFSKTLKDIFAADVTTGVGVIWSGMKALLEGGILGNLFLAFTISAPFLINIILSLIAFFTILFFSIRVLIILITAYVKIIILIILSPLIIIFNALPGQSPFNFQTWLKNLIGEILTFPLLVGIFLVGAVIVNNISTDQLFKPPFLFNLDPDTLVFIIGMTILFMTPDLLKNLKQLILPKPISFPGASPLIFFSSAKSVLGGTLSAGTKIGSTVHYLHPFAKFVKLPGFLKKIFD